MVMKPERHRKILELISDNAITTQEDLMQRLSEAGFSVTQATVSRDIKELRLVKVQSSDGRYVYAKPNQGQEEGAIESFRALLIQSLLHIDYANNMVVVQCKTGMANAVCRLMEQLHWKGIVGTLSGDDTIFVLMRDEPQAAEFVRQLQKLGRA